jgi:hypothetical protein
VLFQATRNQQQQRRETDAACVFILGNSSALTLTADITLRKPSPQKEMWPKRVMRQRNPDITRFLNWGSSDTCGEFLGLFPVFP